MLLSIALQGAYVNIEQWSVNKMKEPYDILLPTLIQVIYQRDNAISIMTNVIGKAINWEDTLFKQMQKEFMKWKTSQTKMMMGTIKVDIKKDICHSTLVIKILMQHFFPNTDQQIPPEVVPIGCKMLLHQS
jgi:hypothetical protein